MRNQGRKQPHGFTADFQNKSFQGVSKVGLGNKGGPREPDPGTRSRNPPPSHPVGSASPLEGLGTRLPWHGLALPQVWVCPRACPSLTPGSWLPGCSHTASHRRSYRGARPTAEAQLAPTSRGVSVLLPLGGSGTHDSPFLQCNYSRVETERDLWARRQQNQYTTPGGKP